MAEILHRALTRLVITIDGRGVSMLGPIADELSEAQKVRLGSVILKAVDRISSEPEWDEAVDGPKAP